MTHTASTAIVDRGGCLAALLEGSSFTSQQLIDLVGATAGLHGRDCSRPVHSREREADHSSNSSGTKCPAALRAATAPHPYSLAERSSYRPPSPPHASSPT